jgi:cellulose synthase/poly-beta-1,6-N-acetylglucosamine synthase-like glycosyltransferase
MNPKVLLFAPISQVKDYCLPQWLEHISNLTYENYHVYLVDNSEYSNFFKKYADSFPNID